MSKKGGGRDDNFKQKLHQKENFLWRLLTGSCFVLFASRKRRGSTQQDGNVLLKCCHDNNDCEKNSQQAFFSLFFSTNSIRKRERTLPRCILCSKRYWTLCRRKKKKRLVILPSLNQSFYIFFSYKFFQVFTFFSCAIKL